MKVRHFAAVVLIVSIAYWAGRARAGVPATTPLFYGGTLEDGNGPLGGSHAITTRLWDAASAGNPLCAEGPAGSTAVTAGRFRVPLDATCTAAVHANADVFIEIKVDGNTLPREKVGAVPYALEAGAVPLSGVTGISATTPWPGSARSIATYGTKKYSNAAAYCGSTPATTGAAGGYGGLKTLCETACGSPTARLCTPPDLIAMLYCGGSVPADGRIDDQFSGIDGDCAAWTSNDSAAYMAIWRATMNILSNAACSVSLPNLCCD